MKINKFGRIFLITLTTMILVVGSMTLLVYIRNSTEQKRKIEQTKTLEKVERSIKEKINEGLDLLYDLRGLADLSEERPGDWDIHFKALLNNERHREYSAAYVQKIEKKDLAKFELEMRKSGIAGYKNYVVFPKLENQVVYPIKYLYTTDPEVKAFLGFDFQYSEKTLMAFKMAVRNNEPTMSELTRLNLILPQSKKTGYELIVPVYKVENIEELPPEKREEQLTGFIGVWLNSNYLKDDSVEVPGLRYSLFDGDQEVFGTGGLQTEKPVYTTAKEFDLLNRKMKIILDSDILFRLSDYEESLPNITLMMIISINLLWILSVYSFLLAEKRTVSLVELATRDLKKFKLAVDGVSEHVIMTDPEGVVIYANKAASNITGYSIEEMIGKKPSLWGGQMPKEYYQEFWKTIKEEKMPFEGEISNRRKKGELYEAEIRVSPIMNETGEIVFFVGIEKDLSKERAVDKIKTEFISLASHQLRTPLSAVKWFTEMLNNGDGGPLTLKQKDFVEKIEESNQREITLVNSLLSLSRIESGKIVVMPKPTDLGTLVKSIIGDFEVNPEGQGKVFIDRVSEDLPEIYIDPDLIRHVYSNLISNAIRYTGQRGEITVKVYVQDGEIVSEVSDNGIGIPMEEQERMFEKFFRASNALKKFTEGSGLGLYLTKTIIESSRGKISFNSVEGKGTTFVFTLPIKSQKNPPMKAGLKLN